MLQRNLVFLSSSADGGADKADSLVRAREVALGDDPLGGIALRVEQSEGALRHLGRALHVLPFANVAAVDGE